MIALFLHTDVDATTYAAGAIDATTRSTRREESENGRRNKARAHASVISQHDHHIFFSQIINASLMPFSCSAMYAKCFVEIVHISLRFISKVQATSSMSRLVAIKLGSSTIAYLPAAWHHRAPLMDGGVCLLASASISTNRIALRTFSTRHSLTTAARRPLAQGCAFSSSSIGIVDPQEKARLHCSKSCLAALLYAHCAVRHSFNINHLSHSCFLVHLLSLFTLSAICKSALEGADMWLAFVVLLLVIAPVRSQSPPVPSWYATRYQRYLGAG